MTSDTLRGHRVRVLRERAGLTVRQLAERAGVAPSSVTRVEQGRSRVGLGWACEALGVPCEAVEQPVLSPGAESLLLALAVGVQPVCLASLAESEGAALLRGEAMLEEADLSLTTVGADHARLLLARLIRLPAQK